MFSFSKFFYQIAIPTVATTTLSSTTASSGYTLCSASQNVCANQGVCYLVNGGVYCVCPQGNTVLAKLEINNLSFLLKIGYTGTYCQTAVSVTSVSTTTSAGYTLCSASQNVCSNQGVCYVVSGGIRCVCPQGNFSLFLS